MKENQNTIWIFKPAASSCGRGIKLFANNEKLPKDKKGFLVSRYLDSPFLINGYKFDMRIYVLVTSFDPLTIYMYQDGLVRFATEKYTTKSLKRRFIHLTNYSVNKRADNFV